MSQASQVRGNQHFMDDIVFKGGVTLPSGVIGNTDIESGAEIDASKLDHQYMLTHTQADGSDVVAQTDIVHIAKAAGELVAVEAVVDQVPTGDYTVTIDVQKSTGGGSFATLMSATVVIDSDNTDRTLEAGSIAGTTTYADGDLIAIVVTVAGSSGTQAQGLCVTACVREAA